jgi:acylphosphatase
VSDSNIVELRTARLYTVSGKVQGVWFRASTRREAERLGISGYAINLDDGNVEVYAVGYPAELDALEAWLAQGPPQADVAGVERRDVPIETADGFITG